MQRSTYIRRPTLWDLGAYDSIDASDDKSSPEVPLTVESEKQPQFDAVGDTDHRPSNLSTRRKRTIAALGGIALLATGLATGLGLSVFRGDALREVLRSPLSSLTHTSPDSPVNHFYVRDKPQNNTDGVIHTRPNKLYGPKNGSHIHSGAKREPGEMTATIKAIVDSIEAVATSIKTRPRIEKRAVWQPQPGVNWTYQLDQPPTASQLKQASMYSVWDVDLFDTPTSSIQAIHAAGSKVICYFSAGTIEDWRADAVNFTASDIGSAMGDWPGENWINTNSMNVRRIMAARLSIAKSKGCDGVDPDNMDAYNHDTGFSLQQKDAISYITFLSSQASQRGLAIGLKNSGEIIPNVINLVQYSVEESCVLYNECAIYKPFVDANKAVFHVEYPKGFGVVNTNTVSSKKMATICSCIPNYKFSPIVKNNNLDKWQQNCP